MRIAIGGIAFALACFTAPSRAASTGPVDGSTTAVADSFQQKYRRDQRERFEALRSESSPRMQVLAGRIYLDRDDPANKLLPKPEDVVVRAAQLAPDDAFVQWVAEQAELTCDTIGASRPDTPIPAAADGAPLAYSEQDAAAAPQRA